MFKEIDYSIYKYLIVSALILLPIIAFPLSTDLSAFIQGGRIIADGGELFKDFFDVKPPFLYYFFAVLAKVFDSNIILYRLFEFLFTAFTLLVSSILLNRMKVGVNVIRTFIVSYALVYVTLNYTNTFQVETLLFLPSIIYFYYISRGDRDYKSAIYSGILLGVMVGLKYTFGIFWIAALLFDFFIAKKKFKEVLAFNIIQITVLVFITLVTFIPTLIGDSWKGYVDYNLYLSNYINQDDLVMTSSSVIYNYITNNFIEFISPFYWSMFIVSFYFVLKEKKDDSKSYSNIFSLCLILSSLLFVTVIMEMKLFIYHFARFFPFFLLAASISIVYLMEQLKLLNKLLLLLVAAWCIFFSPLPRYLNTLKISYNFIFNTEKYSDYFENESKQIYYRTNKTTADYINSKFADKSVLIVNTSNNAIYNQIDKMPVNSFAQSAFYLSPVSNNGLKTVFKKDLNKAEVIVIQTNDYTPHNFLSDKTSKQLLFENDSYKQYLDSNFAFDTLINNTFEIYKRVQLD